MSPAERVERLVAEDAALLLGFFMRRCDVPADAADLLSEVYVVLWRRRSEIPDETREARAWAFGIARGVLANARRTDRRRSALVERLRERLPAVVPPPDVDALVLRAALTGLPAADRELLLMVGADELSAVEVAELLEIPAATVRQRLHRARTRLRDRLPLPCG